MKNLCIGFFFALHAMKISLVKNEILYNESFVHRLFFLEGVTYRVTLLQQFNLRSELYLGYYGTLFARLLREKCISGGLQVTLRSNESRVSSNVAPENWLRRAAR